MCAPPSPSHTQTRKRSQQSPHTNTHNPTHLVGVAPLQPRPLAPHRRRHVRIGLLLSRTAARAARTAGGRWRREDARVRRERQVRFE